MSETPTRPNKPAHSGQRWLIQTDGGEFQLVESERELAELVRLGRVTGTTPVYAIADGPRAFGEIPDLARLMPRAVSSEPPIGRAHRSPERAKLSEELSILNRPLEDEIEYYDEVPIRRWPKRLAFGIALGAAVIGAYLFAVPRFPAWRSWALTRLFHPTSSPRAVAASPSETASPLPAAVVPAAPTVEPAQAAPPVPVPGTPGHTEATAAPVAGNAQGAPVADHRTSTAGGHKASRSTRRHSARNRATFSR